MTLNCYNGQRKSLRIRLHTSTHGDGFHNCRVLLECVPKNLKPCLQQAKGILHNPLHAGQLVAVDPILRNLRLA